MKRTYIVVAFLLIAQLAFAQSRAIYSYDVSGNRIKRKYEPSLPVTLISFKAEKLDSDDQHPAALLKWRTALEVNSSHFDIQRSFDGKKWFGIGTVQASGDKASDTEYAFTDLNPTDGENIYRLKMVDRDSTFAYSSLRSLNFGSLIVFYPSPVKTRLKIKGLIGSESVISTVQIWNVAGKLVRQSAGIPSDGIDMSLLPTGVYTVSIVHKNGATTVKKVLKE